MNGSSVSQQNGHYHHVEDHHHTSDDNHQLVGLVHPMERSKRAEVSNEYVLNIAFISFLMFTIVQFFFAVIAKSDAMMTDCSAMMVDVVTYLFNYLAEQYKHSNYHDMSNDHQSIHEQKQQHKRWVLHCLYLELIPPFISVVTLMVVTIIALKMSIISLLVPVSDDIDDIPNVSIMSCFSGLNLILDVLNVSCFARVDFLNHPLDDTSQPTDQSTDVTSISQHTAGNISSQNQYNTNEESPLLQSSSVIRKPKNPIEQSRTIEVCDMDANAAADDDDDDDCSSIQLDGSSKYNLNMCSAWTHICADTLRSIAVLVASMLAQFCPPNSMFRITPNQADSGATIIVSIIILLSLLPLIKGLFQTAIQIHSIWFASDTNHSDHLSHRSHLDIRTHQ